MPVTDTAPSPSLSPTQAFIMYRSAAVEVGSGVLQSSVGLIFHISFFLFSFSVCVSMPAHIVTVWRNEATRELSSLGDDMEADAASHTISLVPLYLPSVFLNNHLSLYLLSVHF